MARQRARKAFLDAANAKPAEREEKEQTAEEYAALVDAVEIPAPPRILADDSTPEALTSLLATYGGRIAVLSAEGGVFDQIGGRYAKFPSFDVYLKGHAGDMLRVDRIGRAPSTSRRRR